MFNWAVDIIGWTANKLIFLNFLINTKTVQDESYTSKKRIKNYVGKSIFIKMGPWDTKRDWGKVLAKSLIWSFFDFQYILYFPKWFLNNVFDEIRFNAWFCVWLVLVTHLQKILRHLRCWIAAQIDIWLPCWKWSFQQFWSSILSGF